MLDLIIKNGDIVDGTGSKAFKGDLGILNGTIVKIGEISDEAKNIIDNSGLKIYSAIEFKEVTTRIKEVLS